MNDAVESAKDKLQCDIQLILEHKSEFNANATMIEWNGGYEGVDEQQLVEHYY